jgi:hypothetical protein
MLNNVFCRRDIADEPPCVRDKRAPESGDKELECGFVYGGISFERH